MGASSSVLYNLVRNAPLCLDITWKRQTDVYEIARLSVSGDVHVPERMNDGHWDGWAMTIMNFWLHRECIAESEELDDVLFMRSLHDGGEANLLPLMIQIHKETRQERGCKWEDQIFQFIRQEEGGYWWASYSGGHGIERGTVCVSLAMHRLDDVLFFTRNHEPLYNCPPPTQSELDTVEELKSVYIAKVGRRKIDRRYMSIADVNRMDNEKSSQRAMADILKVRAALHSFGITGKKHEQQAAKSATTEGGSK
jgi:hypothetical protein